MSRPLLPLATPLVAALVAVVAFTGAGCRTYMADHCPGCTVLSERAPDLPRLRSDTPATVVLVHGAFGFGPEWDEVVAALRKADIDFVSWSWDGPWRSQPRSTARFAAVLQGLLDAQPPGVPEVVVIAHSAGGALVDNAARRVRVPEGRRLRVLAIAPAQANLSASIDRRFSDEALAQTLVVTQPPLPPVPPRVTVEIYHTDDEPPPGARPPDEQGVRRSYLGDAVGHDESVRVVALPVVEALSSRR